MCWCWCWCWRRQWRTQSEPLREGRGERRRVARTAHILPNDRFCMAAVTSGLGRAFLSRYGRPKPRQLLKDTQYVTCTFQHKKVVIESLYVRNPYSHCIPQIPDHRLLTEASTGCWARSMLFLCLFVASLRGWAHFFHRFRTDVHSKDGRSLSNGNQQRVDASQCIQYNSSDIQKEENNSGMKLAPCREPPRSVPVSHSHHEAAEGPQSEVSHIDVYILRCYAPV